MRGFCPKYQRFLRAYQCALISWGERKDAEGAGIMDGASAALEKKYRSLVDHQQSCPVCLVNLGKDPAPGPDAPVRRRTFGAGAEKRRTRARQPEGLLGFLNARSH